MSHLRQQGRAQLIKLAAVLAAIGGVWGGIVGIRDMVSGTESSVRSIVGKGQAEQPTEPSNAKAPPPTHGPQLLPNTTSARPIVARGAHDPAKEWGPERPTWTFSHPSNYVTMNSITDNPVARDERRFLVVYQRGVHTVRNTMRVYDNEIIVFRVFFSNDAAPNLDLVTLDSRVRVRFPHISRRQSVSAYVTASNGVPRVVWDHVHLHGTRRFFLEYQQGSAQLWTGRVRGAYLSDSIVLPKGVGIGCTSSDGRITGDNTCSGWVTLRVRVQTL